MPKQNHIHRFVKYKKRRGYFRCAFPDCTHFSEKEMVIGKYTQCNKCENTFIMTREDARRSKPLCIECSNTNKAKTKRAITEMLNENVLKINENSSVFDEVTDI